MFVCNWIWKKDFCNTSNKQKIRGMSGHECENWENHKQGTQWHFAHRICRPSVGANTTTTHITTAFMKWSAKWMTDGRTDGWIVGSPTSSIAWILLIIHISSFESIKRSLSFYKLNDSHYNVLCHEQMQLPCRVRSLSFIVLIPVFPFLCKIV